MLNIYLRISVICFVIIAIGIFLRRDKEYKDFTLSSMFLSSLIYGFIPVVQFVFAFSGLMFIVRSINK